MAHKKGQGHSSNGRESAAKRLGVKNFGGQLVRSREYPGKTEGYQISSRI